MPTLALRRRDPWWGLEGPAARRRRRRESVVSFIAFVASIVAIGGAGTLWAIHIGLAAQLGFRVTLALG
jgi:hypothetical protein